MRIRRTSPAGSGPPWPASRETNARLYRAYLLKEQLRMVFAAEGRPGRSLLAGWIARARRSRIPEFVKLAKTIVKFLPLIKNT